MEQTAFAHLQTIWDYMHLNMQPQKAGCIVGFGTYNTEIARRAAQLYRQGLAPLVVFTGGLGRNTSGRCTVSEAAQFAAVAMAEGVPQSAILLEDESTNTMENLLFTRRLLGRLSPVPASVLAVHQPFMERRLFAAWGVYWPEMPVSITSPQYSLARHLELSVAQGITEQAAVEVIVGDFQRMDLYAKKGYQTPQAIPPRAWAAFDALVQAGYTGQLAT